MSKNAVSRNPASGNHTSAKQGDTLPAGPGKRRFSRGIRVPVWILSAAVILSAPGARASTALGSGTLPPLVFNMAPAPGRNPQLALQEAASEFLLNWVDGDGRVVRRDQGNDTVSEGQAYGMLIAAAVGDEKTFQKIWDWTRAHLMRSDGLLAWHWANGAVMDSSPASDADLDAARALAMAGTLFGRADFAADGRHLAGQIMDKLTTMTVHGRILLPGPWADQHAGISYNPSYASPAAFAVLARSTGDPRWQELSTGTAAVAAELLSTNLLLPDWARIRSDGSIQPVDSPNGNGPGRYSYDAARAMVRMGESCLPADVAVAANSAGTLASSQQGSPLTLHGAPYSEEEHPLFYVARAAALAAANRPAAARTNLDRAETLNDAHPSYYGAAWTALGRIYLDSPVLGGRPALWQTSCASADVRSVVEVAGFLQQHQGDQGQHGHGGQVHAH
ncbi:glycosyl hydrolase family 8 [Arthrobacter sp. LAPM80]|uniref:glycosyl hydrolase family 8 n=1 Tax=Arthrobacter sp. LAPM80 TaxID=3141788 RepID=UPI00398B8C7D